MLGVGLAGLVNVFNPEVIVIGGGVIGAGELLLEPARARSSRARAAAGRATACAIVPPRFGAEAGMLGAATARVRGAARRGDGRRAAGRLPDADRQPRGRDAARAGGAARGRRRSPARTRAARACCSTATASRAQLRQLPRAQRARARAPSWSSGCAAGETVALVCDAGMPLVCDPGLRARAGVRRRRARGRGAAGPERGADGARRQRRCRPTRWRFAGFLPRKRGRAARRARRARETLVAFESPRRVAATLAVLAELDPERPVAVCRELTKLHEEVVRGTARRARRALRGASRRAARSCSWSARAAAGAADARAGARGGAPARRGGREAARRGRASSPS